MPRLQRGPAGIAPATQIRHSVSPESACVEQGCRWLHYVCTDAALQELVANWDRLVPPVKIAILDLARGC
jgi:hypothetical protein